MEARRVTVILGTVRVSKAVEDRTRLNRILGLKTRVELLSLREAFHRIRASQEAVPVEMI